ncbi:hypothetical protein NDU88_006817 [Pleurodeles waltl]|uniref:Uncharacterized protein n=1 Tax=Pleurodeles waltl TaxID=8319 RepID=A0AAV7RRC0_PLEWA|nr:hypothetical protein NDU88_006817 [Pleurodeles waltl]
MLVMDTNAICIWCLCTSYNIKLFSCCVKKNLKVTQDRKAKLAITYLQTWFEKYSCVRLRAWTTLTPGDDLGTAAHQDPGPLVSHINTQEVQTWVADVLSHTVRVGRRPGYLTMFKLTPEVLPTEFLHQQTVIADRMKRQKEAIAVNFGTTLNHSGVPPCPKDSRRQPIRCLSADLSPTRPHFLTPT